MTQQMSDDPEIDKIMQRKLQDMVDAQNSPQQPPDAAGAAGIINLTTATFTGAVSSAVPTLVDFWAPWCGPCKSMHPVFEELDAAYPGIKFARVNVDECSSIAATFGIQSIPTFALFKSGIMLNMQMGAIGAQGIHKMCKNAAL